MYLICIFSFWIIKIIIIITLTLLSSLSLVCCKQIFSFSTFSNRALRVSSSLCKKIEKQFFWDLQCKIFLMDINFNILQSKYFNYSN